MFYCPSTIIVWLYVGFIRNARLEDQARKAVTAARSIPDAHVRKDAAGVYEVQSQSQPGLWHTVAGAMTVWSACECLSGQKGSICSHQVWRVIGVGGETVDGGGQGGAMDLETCP